jgi:hypothetical protein
MRSESPQRTLAVIVFGLAVAAAAAWMLGFAVGIFVRTHFGGF